MADAPRYFTLPQANAIVIAIRPLVGEILRLRDAIIQRQAEVWPVIERAIGNGGNRAASQMAQEFDRLDRLVREIQATGAILKDLNLGLVDFPALREGREIYLCWKYGEGEIRFWHEVEDGYAGRQSVD